MARKTKPTQLVESTLPSISASKVDRDKGIIYGVRLGGLESKNKRRYTEAAYKKVLPAYEGKPCNVDHVEEGKQVKTNDRLGIWHSPRWSDSPEPGPVADLHYLKSHPLAERVCEAAERPDLAGTFGMSHIAEASVTSNDTDGWLVIEAFSSITSVDLVADPATVKGLHESQGHKPMKKAIKAIIESVCNFPFQKKVWEAYAKQEDACKRITEEIETPDGASSVDAANAAFNALASGIATDGTLAPKDAGDKLSALKTLQAKMLNGEEDETPAPIVKPDETPAKKEAVLGVAGAGRLCESLKFTPNIKQLTLISEAAEPLAKQLAEEFARLALVKPEQEPTSAGRSEPVVESQIKPVADAKELRETCFA